MPTQCKQETFVFQDLGKRNVVADFGGGYLSSDGGGALFLRAIEARHGVIRRLAGCFEDRRHQGLIEHSVEHLLAQRINGLALGYEDLNDHDDLRRDPLQALAVGKRDLLGEERRESKDRGKALAGSSTLNRLELAAEKPDGRYRKIVACPEKIEALLIEQGVKSIPRKADQIVLDFDATDDPLHGAQEGAYYHGYYKNYCYLPLYCFCGNIPLWAQLRDCKRDASEGTVEALTKIVAAIRKRLGKRVRIIVRADSGFAREAIMAWCEGKPNVYYCLGLAKNSRLAAEIESEFAQLRQEVEAGNCELPCRAFKEFSYRTRQSWSCSRRVVAKMEILPKGENPRYIVSNLPTEGSGNEAQHQFGARELYEEFYCARGDMENRIKEQQIDLFADRTSTRWMASNQLRLWFSAIAHLILEQLRASALVGTELERASIGTIRLKLFKIAARLKVSCRRIHIELCSAYPLKGVFGQAHASLLNAAMPAP